MSEPKYNLELCRQIWNNRLGERIEVAPDKDCLDLVELVFVTKEGERTNHFTIPPEQALLVAEAMRLCAQELLAEKATENEPGRSKCNESCRYFGTGVMHMNCPVPKTVVEV